MRVALTRFSGVGGQDYDDYLRVRYKVFVEEGKWPLDVDADRERCAEDPADHCSSFVLARLADPNATPVGIVRSTVTSLAFPHRELFANHLSRLPMSRLRADSIATVNSLAVLGAFRRRSAIVAGYGQPLTAARALVLEMVDWLRSKGVLLVVASAVPIASARLFGSVGFVVLDPFQEYGPGRPILNMGLVVKGPDMSDGPDDQTAQRLGDDVSAYLVARHVSSTGGRGLAAYVDESLAK